MEAFLSEQRRNEENNRLEGADLLLCGSSRSLHSRLTSLLLDQRDVLTLLPSFWLFCTAPLKKKNNNPPFPSLPPIMEGGGTSVLSRRLPEVNARKSALPSLESFGLSRASCCFLERKMPGLAARKPLPHLSRRRRSRWNPAACPEDKKARDAWLCSVREGGRRLRLALGRSACLGLVLRSRLGVWCSWGYRVQ